VSGALRRWWRRLWPEPGPAEQAGDGHRAASGGSGAGEVEETAASRTPTRRHYTPPPRDDDPERETRLGAVLQALAGGPLTRDALAARVGAAGWGTGRFDAVVAHGVASGVLLVDGTGGATDVVRARYAD
jgi:hypothetical protein